MSEATSSDVIDPTFLEFPAPWFGGKRSVAADVWERFGTVTNFVEPFCGSAAILLARPLPFAGVETINDADAFVANFWRAVQHDPGSVADAMDFPVNEAELEARHKFLCRMPEKTAFTNRVKDDVDFYDARYAGYWCWGLAAWIGSGWCGGEWHGRGNAETKGEGINTKSGTRPHLGSAGRGINKQLPHLGDAGMGIHKKLPHLGNAGRGIHKQLPHLGNAGRGEYDRRREVIFSWINTLRNRLRNVRVCCGDWLRVCKSPATTTTHGTTACFLDPPYSSEAGRANSLYRVEDLSVAHRVREWCLANGDNPEMRICLCGYEGEGHEVLEAAGWEVVAWKAGGGYANQRDNEDDQEGKTNRHRERLWYSPHCLKPDGWLFD